MPKMLQFGEFLKTWSLRSNSVTRHVSFNRTKTGGKCQNSNATFWVIFKHCAQGPFFYFHIKIRFRFPWVSNKHFEVLNKGLKKFCLRFLVAFHRLNASKCLNICLTSNSQIQIICVRYQLKNHSEKIISKTTYITVNSLCKK